VSVNRTVTAEQPSFYKWLVWVVPGFWGSVFLWLILDEVRQSGGLTVQLAGELAPFIAVALLALFVCSLPLLFRVRSVSLGPEGARARFYIGSAASIPWDEIERIDLFTSDSSGGSKKIIRLIPARGRRVMVTDKVSNFRDLEDLILNLPGKVINHSPTVFYQLMRGAKTYK